MENGRKTHAVAIRKDDGTLRLFLRIVRAPSGIYVVFAAGQDRPGILKKAYNPHSSWHNARYLVHREENTDMQALWWLGVFDVPLSAALDTALLPWDSPYWASRPSSPTNNISE